MASSTTQSNHVYVTIRLKMTENINGLDAILFYHYGETDDTFLIDGVVAWSGSDGGGASGSSDPRGIDSREDRFANVA